MESIKRGIYNYFIKKDIENDTQEIQLSRLFSWITIIWIFSGFIFFFTYNHNGEFGDMFGSVNTLFSGLAFGGIIYTIFLQREDRRVQKKEAYENNAKLQEQIKEINIQRFENIFFQMITLHNEITKSIYTPQVVGRENFKSYYGSLKGTRESAIHKYWTYSQNNIPDGTEFLIIQEACEVFFKNKEPDIGHYLRNLYNLFRLVDKNSFIGDIDGKKEYTRIIRSQLSAHEYILLFYNCFQTKGRKFKVFADKYELFDNISIELLLSPHHKELYNRIEIE